MTPHAPIGIFRHKLRRPYRFSDACAAGFTLVELMTALSLAMVLTLGIMVISNTANEIYKATTSKVEQTNRFRLALLTMDRDFSQWVATANMEYYVDGTGAGARLNHMWDEGEQVRDQEDSLGPGVVDGGDYGEYDEFASLTHIQYWGFPPGVDPNDETQRQLHSADQLYFRTYTYIDGRFRSANVEYMLVDPTRKDPRTGKLLPPRVVKGENLANLTLVKEVRYHDFDYETIRRRSEDLRIVRRRVEVASNVTDFKIEYASWNRFDSRFGFTFQSPAEEYDDPSELELRPTREDRGDGLASYRKVFGYGSNDLSNNYTRAIAYKAFQGDRQQVRQHSPVRVGFERNPKIQFAQLRQGDEIFLFTAASRGVQGASGGGAVRLDGFRGGRFTVRSNLAGRLEFFEPIESVHWRGNQSPVLYKAAFTPPAVRVTLRVVDDRGQNPRTFQRVIWIRRRAG